MKPIIFDIETLAADDEQLDLEQSFLKPSGNIKDPKKKE